MTMYGLECLGDTDWLLNFLPWPCIHRHTSGRQGYEEEPGKLQPSPSMPDLSCTIGLSLKPSFSDLLLGCSVLESTQC